MRNRELGGIGAIGWLSLTAGTILRAWVMLYEPMARWCARSAVLNSVNTAYERVLEAEAREGAWIHRTSTLHEYDGGGGIFLGTPAAVALVNLIGPLGYMVLVLLADVAVAFCLARLAMGSRFADRKMMGWPMADAVVLLHMLNPVSIVAGAGSVGTAVFAHFGVVLALLCASLGHSVLAGAALGLAGSVAVWPFALMPLLLGVHPSGASKRLVWPGLLFGVAASAASMALLCTLWAGGSWSWVAVMARGYFGALGPFEPDLGLWWYMFMELFREFSVLYGYIALALSLVWIVPVAFRYRAQPLFAFWAGSFAVLLFKPRLVLGELLLPLSLAPLVADSLQNSYGTAHLAAAAVLVSAAFPVCWDMWMFSGAGNANFYFAMTTVFMLLVGLVLKQSLSSALQS